jgi:hypothetical protein
MQLPAGGVATSLWLKTLGISNNLQQAYKRSGWLKPIGQGAFIKYNNKPDVYGAISALQEQLKIKTHIGANSALSIRGYNHFAKLNSEQIRLFAPLNAQIPKWFVDNFMRDEKPQCLIFKTSLFSAQSALETVVQNNFKLTISTPERAIFETLYLTPKHADIKQIYQSLELMANLKPDVLQNLLEKCSSIKVKRLFLYISDKIGHGWFKYLNLDKIELGSGKRIITKGGKLDKKYNIVIENLSV